MPRPQGVTISHRHRRLVPLLGLLLAGCASPEPEDPVTVRWIAVFASDYDLELEPDFDPDVSSYSAVADEAGIVVFAEVLLSGGDATAVTVNDIPAAPSGYRTWVSASDAGFEAPTTLDVEISLPDATVHDYTIDVTIP